VATFAVVVLAQMLLRPLHLRAMVFDVSTGLTAGTYLTAAAVGITTFRWFQTAPKATLRITVQDLRRRATARGRAEVG
jgi:hypothetical protein